VCKQFYVLWWPAKGRAKVVPDWGDYAWGAATYSVHGPYPTRKQATAVAREFRDCSNFWPPGNNPLTA
jgi:hypothetical protein